MSHRERLAIIAAVYEQWAAEQPPTAYSTPSGSAEGVEALSASAEAQAELYRRTCDALRAAGLPT